MGLLNFDDNKDWKSIVSADDLIDLNIIFLGGRASGIPSNNLFFTINLAHHCKHFFMVDVVEEPDIGLL